MCNRSDKVLVAISGGVDSAVAAALLQEEGYDVTGVFLCMKNAADDQAASQACCSPADAEDAKQVAGILGIQLLTLPVSDAFDPIIEDFVAEYAHGRTPNPCIHCNTKIKFGRLFDVADSLGAKYIATGHHAQITNDDGQPVIARARGREKDQSYALCGIPRNRLSRILLPVGELEGKERVRRIARRMGLSVHDKPDSQEVCFVPNDDYVSLLRERAPEALRTGKIVTSDGQVLGNHDGYARFTIGQRRGLGVATGEPIYVIGIDPETATVTAGPREEIMSDRLAASKANWHRDVPDEFKGVVQIRYNHSGATGTVRITSPTTFEVAFDAPVSAITPGQAAVVYDDDRLLGGGWIEAQKGIPPWPAYTKT
ncbi:MAG: tRNA 2-thiouridine(34) synthase MnmA [Phycisphaerae bacterium]|nr:tRNA 2-thiouridine(34) synthase MnmA [Phycisphaerae bacterium]